MKRNKRKIYFAIFWAVLVVSFAFFATVLILMANGYHLNRGNFTLEKTGMLVINGKENNVLINLNGKVKPANLPAKYYKLFPGRYDLRITKEGYHGWGESFDLTGGQAVILNNIDLYLIDPKVTNQGADEKIINRIKNGFELQKKQIKIKNNELWYDAKFVTRFSQPILGAIFDPSTKHFYVQLDREIHALEQDGGNNTLLTTLQNSNPVVLSSNDDELQYIENGSSFSVDLW